MGGSALAVNWANEHVPAILDAWYPGEEGGTAIADVLFGDYNPSGRLPVTFYKSANQLPPFEDYRLQGRTYRYFKGDALYRFGYGLSYTNFKYGNMRLSSRDVRAGETLTVSAEVANTGNRAGDEVAQLYLSQLTASVAVPVRVLVGFKRLFLNPGERRSVTFNISPEQMSLIDDQGKRVIEPGEFEISVGGGQPVRGRAKHQTTRFSVIGSKGWL
jgi:beta-glucosidase